MSDSPIPLDVVNALDVLGKAIEGEQALRTMAGMAWARGDREDVMIAAHARSIERVREAAKALLELERLP